MYYLMDWPAKPAQWTSAVLKFLKRFERSAAVEQFERFVPALEGRTEPRLPYPNSNSGLWMSPPHISMGLPTGYSIA